MELLDRYLYAVGTHVPSSKRDDIIRELRANILDDAEEREAALARSLTLDEEAELLKGYGHPALVGLRYLPKQYLIGPALFPSYVFVLKIVLGLVFLVYAVVNAVSIAAQSVTWRSILEIWFGLQHLLLNTAAWVTLIFVVIEYAQVRQVRNINFFEKWDPLALPSAPRQPAPSRSRSALEVLGSSLALVFFLLLPHFPRLALGPAAEQLRYVTLAPQWTTFYWAFVALLFAQWLIEVIAITVMRFSAVRPVLGMMGRAAIAVLFGFMLRVPVFVWLNDAGRAVQRPPSFIETLNNGLRAGLKCAIVILIAQLLWELVRRVQATPSGSNSHARV